MPSKTFKSKVDTWLIAVFVIVALLSLIVIVPLLVTASGAAYLIALLVVAISMGLPLWIYRTTVYVIDGESLSIKSGPFSWNISLSDINAVKESRSLLSSPAFSLDRLAIDYGNGRSILVSPLDKAGFIEALEPAE